MPSLVNISKLATIIWYFCEVVHIVEKLFLGFFGKCSMLISKEIGGWMDFSQNERRKDHAAFPF